MKFISELTTCLQTHRKAAYMLLRSLVEQDREFLLSTDLTEACAAFCKGREGGELADSPLARMLCQSEEAAIRSPWIYLSVRPAIAEWKFLRIHTEEVMCEEVTVNEMLRFKERLVEAEQNEDEWVLEVDLRPFERGFPKLREASSIGQGVEFLNRHLCGRLFSDLERGGQRLLEFLRLHEIAGRPIMLSRQIEDVDQLRQSLRGARKRLRSVDPETPWSDLAGEMAVLGFEPGWGRTARQAAEMMGLLADVLEAPAPQPLEALLSRIPMVTRLAIVSPHGYFGQADVLGKPDTGGQVVYILDQVRAMEKEMRNNLRERGLDIEPQILVLSRLIPDAGGTTCDQRIEHIIGTRNARILRVPFRTKQGEVIRRWIRRFDVWPYLERFAAEARKEVVAELEGRPDMIIGNYSDGNLVATLMAQRLGVTLCTIAHALEKTKYLYSALNWKKFESSHHFACQFTADLIAMNAADFIVTSSFQEIAGRPDGQGQYESHAAFTLPGLYRVVGGIDVFDPKFNIVSPGADDGVFFPHTETERRSARMTDHVRAMIFDGDGDGAAGRGRLADAGKPLLFAMSRLDPVKNVTGLVEWYAGDEDLRNRANLLIVGGHLDPEQSDDDDERREIETLHRLIESHGLDGQMRWLPMQTEKNIVGEIYRVTADLRGAFVQPALFEAFGLTVIEAMASGLPVFATRFGGPLEIIEDGTSGFHIDPNHGDAAARSMAGFFNRCGDDASYWDAMSKGAINRVRTNYTWNLYARRILSLSRVYGFWKHISTIEREETRRYIEMLYGLMYRPLAANVPESPA